jgi:hypothetical protein
VIDGVTNPLFDLPGTGWLVRLIDEPLDDAGFALWLAEAVELVAVGGLLFVLLQGLTRSVLPRVFPAAVGPTVALVGGVRNLLLLPQLAASVVYDRAQRPPARPVYAYGQAVMAIADALEAFARWALQRCTAIRKTPDGALFMLLALLFALWNNDYCDPAQSSCVSPVAHWFGQL